MATSLPAGGAVMVENAAIRARADVDVDARRRRAEREPRE
jgi:hypothetical protein